MAAKAPLLALLGLLVAAPLASGALDWPAMHGNLANTRAAATTLSPSTVDDLGEAWRYRAGGSVTGTPAVADGVVYFGDWRGGVHAVDLETGETVWSVDHGAGVDASLALDAERVYVNDMAGNVTARDRATGAVVWRTRADAFDGVHLYGSPVVHDGRLYTGVASEQTLIEYEGPQDFRGSVIALDAGTGRILWRTYMQEPGRAGASVWSTPALDPGNGLLFVGTGNAYGHPAGNLSDSIVALRMADGAIAWSFQATSNDGFDARGSSGPDADFGASPILFEIDGRQVVGNGDKRGEFFVLDRLAGERVWSRKVDFVPPGAAPSQKEGFLGSAAYRDGVVFAPTTARSMVHALDARTGEILWATELNEFPRTYGERMFGSTTAGDGVVVQGNAFGDLHLLDAQTGGVLRTIRHGGDVQGGVSLAGGYVVVPDAGGVLWDGNGNVTAYRVGDGSAPPATPPTQDPGGGLPQEEGAVVRALGGVFEPSVLEVAPGQTVRFVNEDGMGHTVTSSWDDGATFHALLSAGESFEWTFDAPGEYRIHCVPHAARQDDGTYAGMVATVLVADEPPTEGPGPKRTPASGLLALVLALGAAALAARRP